MVVTSVRLNTWALLCCKFVPWHQALMSVFPEMSSAGLADIFKIARLAECVASALHDRQCHIGLYTERMNQGPFLGALLRDVVQWNPQSLVTRCDLDRDGVQQCHSGGSRSRASRRGLKNGSCMARSEDASLETRRRGRSWSKWSGTVFKRSCGIGET